MKTDRTFCHLILTAYGKESELEVEVTYHYSVSENGEYERGGRKLSPDWGPSVDIKKITFKNHNIIDMLTDKQIIAIEEEIISSYE